MTNKNKTKSCSCGCNKQYATYFRDGKYWISKGHYRKANKTKTAAAPAV